MKNKSKAFSSCHNILHCPICKSDLLSNENSLLCENNHCFDISKYGYVNLLLKNKNQLFYDKENFKNRNLILESGFYDEILNNILKFIEDKNIKNVVDIGCGEGFYSRKIANTISSIDITALDISKDSLIVAAKKDINFGVKWLVSDLSNLPIKSHSIDLLLNIFSPANYKEFKRVLSDKGYILKVVPTENHLKEIREIAKNSLRNKEYSNENVLSFFNDNFDIYKKYTVTKTLYLSDENKEAFLKMTPLLFNVDISSLDWSDLHEVTVEADLIIGK